MTPDAIGAGTIKRLAELRTGGGPTLSVHLDLETKTLSTPVLSLVAVAAAPDDGVWRPMPSGSRRSAIDRKSASGTTVTRVYVPAIARRCAGSSRPHITGWVWVVNGGRGL